jgi:hypothetical protein
MALPERRMTMTWDTVQQFVRICLGWLAAFLVARGKLDPANAETLTGALLGVAQVGWWYFWNTFKRPA